jgi:hypothetical protein
MSSQIASSREALVACLARICLSRRLRLRLRGRLVHVLHRYIPHAGHIWEGWQRHLAGHGVRHMHGRVHRPRRCV